MRSLPASHAVELDTAVVFLLDRQDPDGLWRDYDLEPGASETWTTCVAGLALTRFPEARAAVDRARDAVAGLARPDGWGYNGLTASDADTTSFAIRFVRGDPSVLTRFLDAEGNAHTFIGAQFGSWGWAHADVTATVGLAVGGARMRGAILAARQRAGAWRSFWWTTHAYATARSLELLAATGGIPEAVAADVEEWLAGAPEPETAFEAAQFLTVATSLGATTHASIATLESFRLPDGGWPASPALLTPRQSDGAPGAPHADVRRILTTASALAALGGIETGGGP